MFGKMFLFVYWRCVCGYEVRKVVWDLERKFFIYNFLIESIGNR